MLVKDICRQGGISFATSYQWKCKYGGLDDFKLCRLKELKALNDKLKRMYADWINKRIYRVDNAMKLHLKRAAERVLHHLKRAYTSQLRLVSGLYE